jgi:hypothetical protein
VPVRFRPSVPKMKLALDSSGAFSLSKADYCNPTRAINPYDSRCLQENMEGAAA